MKIKVGMAIAALAILMGGCVTPPQTPISLNSTALDTKSGKMGVAMSTMPKLDTHLPGAGCLLCLAAASMANASLTTHTRTLPTDDLASIKNEVVALLKKKGVDVVTVQEDLDFEKLSNFSAKGPGVAEKDFSSLKKKYNIDRLLVLQVKDLGMLRTYSAYFPTSDPKGWFNGFGYIVNLSNNTYEWYEPINIAKSADGKWDEPPKFPGLTNAYFQALQLAKDQFTKPFTQ
jgi:hypothetical protein